MADWLSNDDVNWSLDWELYERSTQRKIGILEASKRDGLVLPWIPSERISGFKGDCKDWGAKRLGGTTIDYTFSPPKERQAIDLICAPELKPN